MAISLPQKRPMSRRDCHATLAMTAWQKLGTREIPIADHRRSADPLPTEPVPPQHRSIAVLIITSNERQAVSNAVAVINDAVNSMAAGETHVLHIHAT